MTRNIPIDNSLIDSHQADMARRAAQQSAQARADRLVPQAKALAIASVGLGAGVGLILLAASWLVTRTPHIVEIPEPVVVESEVVVKEPVIVEREVVVPEPVIIEKEVAVVDTQIHEVDRLVYRDRLIVQAEQAQSPETAISGAMETLARQEGLAPEEMDDFEFIVFRDIPFGPVDGYDRVVIGSQFSAPDTPPVRQWCYVSKDLPGQSAAGPRITLAELVDGGRRDLPITQDAAIQGLTSVETLQSAQAACAF